MTFNWIDWIILAVVLYQAYQGWETGIVSLGSSFISFAVSFWLAITYHNQVSQFLTDKFGIAASWSLVLGYLTVAIVSQFLIGELLYVASLRLPKQIRDSKFNTWLGAIISAGNGLLVLTLFFLIILGLPLRGTVKKDITNSTLGSRLVNFANRYGGPLKSSVDQMQKEAVKFFTIDPSSKENINLNIDAKPGDLFVDDASERQMVVLVNQERAKVGSPELVIDVRLTEAARAHSRDMFENRYFSHISPDGKDPAQRLKDAGIEFSAMGENLAYSPDLPTAHQGLMNSPEHKKNILDPAFHHIGIGIISTESWGMMVTQEFMN